MSAACNSLCYDPPKYEKLIRFLLSKISEVDIPENEIGVSAVHWLCNSHSPAVAQMFLERGINPNRYDNEGRPGPFYLVDSCSNNQDAIAILDLLVKYGYDLNEHPANGIPILAHYLNSISIRNCVDIVEWLVSHGANPHLKFIYQKNTTSCYELAKKKKSEPFHEILEIFNKYFPTPSN